MSNWQYANNVPTKQFRSANTLPRDIELYEGSDGELYLAATPALEVNALRTGKALKYGAFPPEQRRYPGNCRSKTAVSVRLISNWLPARPIKYTLRCPMIRMNRL